MILYPVEAMNAVMSALYGSSLSEISFADLRGINVGFRFEEIDLAIEKLKRSDLLVVSVIDGVIRKTGPGVSSFVGRTYLAQGLGAQYIQQSSAAAIVHVIVEGTHSQPTGAAGFYCVEAAGRIVTAEHCVSGRNILRIEDASGRVLHAPPIRVLPMVDGLDLAILDVAASETRPVLSIELDQDEITELMPVYVAGFPQVPQQQVSLFWRSAELSAITENYSRRKSYLINKVTKGGFSGGPALSKNGRVVGMVSGSPFDAAATSGEDPGQDEITPESGRQLYDSEYSVLTPGWYIRELMKQIEPIREK